MKELQYIFISMEIPERVNRVTFSNFFWVVASRNTLANESMFKVDSKRDTRPASINVIRVSLLLVWNIVLKYLTESDFSKISGL